MIEKPVFGTDFYVGMQQRRTLESDFPALKPYLSRGLDVLDVGCGPGAITVGVADIVRPGSVVGVDRTERMIEEATALAETNQVTNARFLVGDAYTLDFPDGTFDVTYSHALIGWLREPVRALLEQKRVTKKGGWVLSHYVDYGATLMYPACPALDLLWAAGRQFGDYSDPEFFANQFVGRELFALFSQAGLRDISMRGTVEDLEMAYAGSQHFEFRYGFLKLTCTDPQSPGLVKLRNKGVIDEETVKAAALELEAWHSHPHAFHMIAGVFAAGRVGW